MITTAFNYNVYSFLMQEGYTHLYLKGLQTTSATGEVNYYVQSLKKDDTRIADLEWDGLAISLKEEEALLLLEQLETCAVMVEWTVAEYGAFLLAMNE